jgi:hypothetical protein
LRLVGMNVAERPNYHIFLWPEPPELRTYFCLLCDLRGCTETEMRAHVSLVHAVEPAPTPMAAQPEELLPPGAGVAR